jgi:transketolase
MNNSKIKISREVVIERIYEYMLVNKNIIFLSDDFGAIALDKLRKKFKDRFINVGIAEQNLINISVGLSLEGFIVYAYGIAPFLTMRPYEQIRVNLSLLSSIKDLNVNLISVGAGLSYDISGPTHHCLEDISIINVLPNFILFSPSDWVLAEKFIDYSINVNKIKYIRLDGKPLKQIYKNRKIDFEIGFCEIKRGRKVCIVATGYMVHTAIKVAKSCSNLDIGIIDIFLLKPFNEELLSKILKKYEYIITLEEGFKNKGGLDTLVWNLINREKLNIKLINLGFENKYIFEVGSREYLHKLNGLDVNSIIKIIKNI